MTWQIIVQESYNNEIKFDSRNIYHANISYVTEENVNFKLLDLIQYAKNYFKTIFMEKCSEGMFRKNNLKLNNNLTFIRIRRWLIFFSVYLRLGQSTNYWTPRGIQVGS